MKIEFQYYTTINSGDWFNILILGKIYGCILPYWNSSKAINNKYPQPSKIQN